MHHEAETPHHPDFSHADREVHRHAHNTGGGYGHWLRTGSALVPLIIGEVVKDPEKRWRYIRIASVAMAFVSEGVHAHRVEQQRKERDRNWQR